MLGGASSDGTAMESCRETKASIEILNDKTKLNLKKKKLTREES